MNKAFFLRKADKKQEWFLVDAKDKVLGRLATKISDLLRGKREPYYTPHTNAQRYVVVVNADKIVLTGDKWNNKEYIRVSGWIGNKKVFKAKEVHAKHPTWLVKYAVKRMLPKNKLSRELFRQLKIYAGSDHPHAVQNPKQFSI